MKKRACALLLMCAAVFALLQTQTVTKPPHPQEEKTEEEPAYTALSVQNDVTESDKADDAVTVPSGYIVADYNGAVAVYNVYSDGLKIMTRLTKIRTDTLPESDRENLKSGIDAPNEEYVIRLLEDFSS